MSCWTSFYIVNNYWTILLTFISQFHFIHTDQQWASYTLHTVPYIQFTKFRFLVPPATELEAFVSIENPTRQLLPPNLLFPSHLLRYIQRDPIHTQAHCYYLKRQFLSQKTYSKPVSVFWHLCIWQNWLQSNFAIQGIQVLVWDSGWTKSCYVRQGWRAWQRFMPSLSSPYQFLQLLCDESLNKTGCSKLITSAKYSLLVFVVTGVDNIESVLFHNGLIPK